MNKHIERANRWLAKNIGKKLPHHLAERAGMVPARKSMDYIHTSKYLPHQGKRECARRVEQIYEANLRAVLLRKTS